MLRKLWIACVFLLTLILTLSMQTSVFAKAPSLSLSGEANTRKLSPMDLRIKYEKELLKVPFAILPHHTSYILPVTYNFNPNNSMARTMDLDIQPVEMKYQLSLKVALLRNIFNDNGYLYLGYTQQSYWQAYNSIHSSPFRETNYEPELMLSFFNDYRIGSWRNRLITVGLVHQSNGKGIDLSRSWNRIYADFKFEAGDFCIGVKPWFRIHEESGNDDNPDIEKYLGYGEFHLTYFYKNHAFSTLLKNNLAVPNRLGVMLDWSFPLTDKVNGYVQYYGGYGENLIDHDHKNQRLGIGIKIASWF